MIFLTLEDNITETVMKLVRFIKVDNGRIIKSDVIVVKSDLNESLIR